MSRFTALAIMLMASFCVTAHGAIIAIDFGSKFIKVAAVQPGRPFDTVTDFSSKRKTPNVVAFDNDMRVFGGEAKSLATRKPDLYLSYPRYLLGRGTDNEMISKFADHHYPYELVQLDDGAMGFQVTGSDFEGVYTSEEVIAQIIMNSHKYSEVFADQPVLDAVITVPSFFTQFERQALLDAASLTKLNVISLIDENTAAHLQYGISRVFNETHRMMIYNMGATSTQVSIAEYTAVTKKSFGKEVAAGQFSVVGKAWDTTLGGDDWDKLLIDLFVDTFNTKYGEPKNLGDITANARAMAKIRVKATKTKEILTANRDIPVSIESLFKDVDFRTKVTRKELEVLAEDLFARVLAPIDAALESAGLTREDIDELEVIGGGFRIPKIQKIITESFGREPSVHLNGDESPALGAVFHAANQSTSFRVRHVGMQDMTPFAIGVRLNDLIAVDEAEAEAAAKDEEVEEWTKRATLYKKQNRLGSKKVIAFTHSQDIQCMMQYEDSDILPVGTPKNIATYSVTGIDEIRDGELGKLGAPKISLHFFVDKSGISKLVKAEAVIEEATIVKERVLIEEETDETEAGDEEAATDEETATETATDAEADKEAVEADSDAAIGEDVEKAVEDDAEKVVEDDDSKYEIIESLKVKKHKIPLTVTRTDVGVVRKPMSVEQFNASKEKLAALDAADEHRQMKEAAKNSLESYIYSVRAKVFDEFEHLLEFVTTDDQRESLREKMTEYEDWLYDDGDNAEIEEYETRLKGLKSDASAILMRMSEYKARPKALAKINNQLRDAKDKVETWAEDKPWINVNETARAQKAISSTEEWLEEQVEEQELKELTEAPAFKAAEVKDRGKKMKALVDRIGRKPKPLPPKKKKKKKKSQDGEEDVDVATGAEGEAAETVNEDEVTKEEATGEEDVKDEL